MHHAAKATAAIAHAAHPALSSIHHPAHKEPEHVSTHPAAHTAVHQANVHKALDSATKLDPHAKKPVDHMDANPSHTLAKLQEAHAVIKAKIPAKAHEPVHHTVKAAEHHLEEAKSAVSHLNAAKHEVTTKEKQVHETAQKSAEASHEAHKAATKVEHTKALAKTGQASHHDVEKATKESDEKTSKAHEAASKHVTAVADKKKAETKVEQHKADAKVAVEAATKLTMVAAKTSKPAAATATKDAAKNVKKAVGHLEPKHALEHVKVKTDCDFLNDALLLGELKSMPHLDPEYSCIGFGGHIDGGEMQVGAVKCKPLPGGACPTHFDEHNCKIVPLDVNHVEFKSLF
jgi:hypothetical protein